MPLIHPIQTTTDPILPSWLELYELAFPYNQRILVARILEGLEPFKINQNSRLLALLDDTEQFAGLIMFRVYPQHDLGVLYYLATPPERRNQGLGAVFYQRAIHELFQDVSWLMFEVEMPILAEDETHRRLAERRINFYQRQGAHLLQGIDYLQSVGSHCPPIPMHLMFQTRPGIAFEPQAAYDTVARLVGDNLKQTTTLSWL